MSFKTGAGHLTRHLLVGTALAVIAAAATPAAAVNAAQQSPGAVQFNIPAQDLGTALSQFARQSGQQLLFAPELVAGRRSNPLVGSYTPREGLMRLLSGSSIGFRMSPSGAYLLASVGPGSGEAQAGGAAADSESADVGATPDILVVGRRTLNADIRRTEDDAQPYVTFDARQIANSQATNVEDFLRTRLPMNTVQGVNAQTNGAIQGNQSSINLRGLGTNQTLVLVDGRRMPSVNNNAVGLLTQPDINGIPLAAIERIEVLPSTASGIYGGGATGGVVNVITRRNYSGVDISIGYGTSFRGDAGHLRIDAAAGFNLLGASIRVTASHRETDTLLEGDRDFAVRGRALQFQNNPAAFLAATNPTSGFTSNIRSQNGSNLVLRSGQALGSPITFVPVGYAGPQSDGGQALVVNAGRYNLDIPNDTVAGRRLALLSGPTVDTAALSVRRGFGPLEIFSDLSWSRNRSLTFSTLGVNSLVTLSLNAPNNPFTTPILVNFPQTNITTPVRNSLETLRGLGGVIVRLPWQWSGAVDYSWTRSRSRDERTNPFAGDPDGVAGPQPSIATNLSNGTINIVRDLNAFPIDYSPYLLPSPNFILRPADTVLQDLNARLSGPLFRLPGGPVTLTALYEWRRETAEDFSRDRVSANNVASTVYFASTRQDVTSYYAEVSAPLFSANTESMFGRALTLTGSVRRDSYSTRAPLPASVTRTPPTAPLPAITYVDSAVGATRYTLALLYAPTQDVQFRASYGTGFLAPTASQLIPGLVSPDNTLTIQDPKRGNISQAIVVTRGLGGNANLQPESSRSLSIGVVFTPRFLPNFRLGIDYTRIRKSNEISIPQTPQIAVDLEDAFPGLILRAPLTPADQAAGFTGGAIQRINQTNINIARTHLEAIDIQADYYLRAGALDEFHFYAVATWAPHFRRQLLPSSLVLDLTGYAGGPLEWRANGGIEWTRGPWTAGWNVQFYDSYRAYTVESGAGGVASSLLNQGSETIRSQSYHDAFLRYRFDDSAAVLRGLQVTFGIQNLFDRRPPILATTAASGGYSGYGDPRLRRVTVTLERHF